MMPALTLVGAVLYWWLAANPGPLRGARLYGAAVPAKGAVSAPRWQTALLTKQHVIADGRAQPLAGVVVLEVGGSAVARKRPNADGVVSWGTLPVEVGERVRLIHQDSRVVLLAGVVSPVEPSEVSQRGGSLSGVQKPKETTWQVSLSRAVLAVPFPATLRIRVAADESVPVTVELSGAHLASGKQRVAVPLVNGEATVEIVPEQHRVELKLETQVGGSLASFWSALPVVPGALDARWLRGALEVTSPIPRRFAYVDLWSEAGALGAYDVELVDGRRGVISPSALAEGEAASVLRRAARWAVTSSEFDLQSMALVGWPLQTSQPAERTFDARSVLLFDGVAEARAERRQNERAVRKRLFTVAALLALFEGLGLFLYVRFPERLVADSHQEAQDAEERALLSGTLKAPVTMQLVASAVAALGALGLLWTLLGR